MPDRIDDVLVVGGGDAGLLTGLSLRQFNPDLDVTIVDDFSQEVPQVGKSTFLAIFNLLHDSLGIDEQRFVTSVKPIWKASVYFRDWCDDDPFHYPFDVATKFPGPDTPDAIERYALYYHDHYDSADHRTKCEAIVEQGKSPWYYSARHGGQRKYNNVAYHFDTERFNDFLRDLCEERGISLVDDDVVDVETSGKHVERVKSEDTAYEADLYVDATGFNRVLVGELDREYRSFDMPLDSAFNTRVPRDLADVVPATVIETGEYGWFWSIDTYDDRDMGYVYAAEFVDDEDARAEFVDFCNGNLPADNPAAGTVSADDCAKYTFDSGFHEAAWVDNCLAIGNAAGFVEPLQSTGLTVNCQAAVNLSNLLAGHGRILDDGVRGKYNAWVRRSWESIYDFVSVHYRYASGESDFWRRMQTIDVSPRVEHLEEEWDRNGFDTNIDPVVTDQSIEDLIIFRPRNFYTLMRSMGAESVFYEVNDVDVSEDVRDSEDERYREIREDVAEHLTTEALYKGALGL